MRKRLLLIGGSGFVGSHIAAIFGPGYEVIARGRDLEVRNIELLEQAVAEIEPDHVIYLAAVTTVRESIGNPRETYDVNFLGFLNVLMALRKWRFQGRVLFVSSSEVYGLLAGNELPVTELRPVRPVSPYAVSKIAGEVLSYQWSQAEGYEIVVARPFNHIGPGQSERFAIANFGRQIAAIKLGLSEPVIHIGDIDTTRDFLDVRDVVVAYKLLLELGRSGDVYNVCSGMERTIRSLIERMCELAGVTVELRTDAHRFRPSEQRRVCGSNAKLIEATGWLQGYSIDQTLSDILQFWSDSIKPLHVRTGLPSRHKKES